MKKVLIFLVLGILLLPVILRLLPEAMGVERVQQAFREAGYEALDLREVESPERDAVEQWRFTVDGYSIELFRYNSEGKIAKHVEYLKPDIGSAIVESMNLAEQLGAAKSRDLPSAVLRKGMWMIYVQGEERSVCTTLAGIFKRS